MQEGWKIIYLNRSNKLNQALSNVLSSHRKKAHKFHHAKEEYKLNIEPEHLITEIKERILYDKLESKTLEDLNYFSVSYERDLSDGRNQQATINHILDFLQLDKRASSTAHFKINTQKQKDLIHN